MPPRSRRIKGRQSSHKRECGVEITTETPTQLGNENNHQKKETTKWKTTTQKTSIFHIDHVGGELSITELIIMFDISWGELFIIGGVSIALIGRKDLPKASYLLGSKIGQVVGLLQGARARADQFATNHELKALQNELRSGLRELDAVKGELAVAASSRGLIGRGLANTTVGSPIPSASSAIRSQSDSLKSSSSTNMTSQPSSQIPVISNSDYLSAARARGDANQSEGKPFDQLPPRSQSVAAVAEEEWQKQGIGFKSRAEMGTGRYWGQMSSPSSAVNTNMSGSVLLSQLMQQSLIHDQYDRAVLEQDQILQAKVDKSKQNLKQE